MLLAPGSAARSEEYPDNLLCSVLDVLRLRSQQPRKTQRDGRQNRTPSVGSKQILCGNSQRAGDLLDRVEGRAPFSVLDTVDRIYRDARRFAEFLLRESMSFSKFADSTSYAFGC